MEPFDYFSSFISEAIDFGSYEIVSYEMNIFVTKLSKLYDCKPKTILKAIVYHS